MKGKVTREIKMNKYEKDGETVFAAPDDSRRAFELAREGYELAQEERPVAWEISMDDFVKYGHAKE